MDTFILIHIGRGKANCLFLAIDSVPDAWVEDIGFVHTVETKTKQIISSLFNYESENSQGSQPALSDKQGADEIRTFNLKKLLNFI